MGRAIDGGRDFWQRCCRLGFRARKTVGKVGALAIAAWLLFMAGNALVATKAQEIAIEERVIGVTAQCDNGNYSTARGSGACSGHGGVYYWLER